MTTGLVRTAVASALLYAARRYYRNWGATKEECHLWLPGDELIRKPSVQLTEGVWIDAPPAVIWPWLSRIGHHDGAVTAGDRVRLAPPGRSKSMVGATFSVDRVIDGEAIVLRGMPPDFPSDAVWSLHLEPRWEDRSRLLLRMRTQLRHPGDALKMELAGPAIAFTTRAILLNIKRRAESAAPAPVLQRAI